MIRLIIAATLLAFSVNIAHAHDHSEPDNDAWYAALKQPDNPTISCCGEADAYWCDDIHITKGVTSCKITDDRDDEKVGRKHHVDLGTEVIIPNYKLKWDAGNPTGHFIVFLSPQLFVWCFIQAGGI